MGYLVPKYRMKIGPVTNDKIAGQHRRGVSLNEQPNHLARGGGSIPVTSVSLLPSLLGPLTLDN